MVTELNEVVEGKLEWSEELKSATVVVQAPLVQV